MKNNNFFKKYKTTKQIILVLLIASILISISQLVRGYIQGDVMGSYKNRYENYLALYNPEKYLKDDIFVVDTVFIEEYTTTGNSRSSTKSIDYTVIRGNLLNSKIKQEMNCHYVAILNDTNYHIINNKKVKLLKVLKNKINGNVFLEDKRYISATKFDAVAGLCIPLFSILLIIILLILKIKSK